jgi:hypothetical protein
LRAAPFIVALALFLTGMGVSALLLAHALQRARQDGYEAARLAAVVAAREQEAKHQQLARELDARSQQRILELQRSHDALVTRYQSLLEGAARSSSGDGPCLDPELVRGLDALGR